MGASEEGSRKRKQLWTVCCQEMEVILRLYILSIILEEWNRVKSIIGKAASVADVNRKGGCLVTFIVRTMFVLCVCVIRLWSVFLFFFFFYLTHHGQSGLSCGLWRHLCSSGEYQVLTDSPSQVLEIRNYFSIPQLKSSPVLCHAKVSFHAVRLSKTKIQRDHPHLKPCDWFLLNQIQIKWKLISPGGI